MIDNILFAITLMVVGFGVGAFTQMVRDNAVTVTCHCGRVTRSLICLDPADKGRLSQIISEDCLGCCAERLVSTDPNGFTTNVVAERPNPQSSTERESRSIVG